MTVSRSVRFAFVRFKGTPTSGSQLPGRAGDHRRARRSRSGSRIGDAQVLKARRSHWLRVCYAAWSDAGESRLPSWRAYGDPLVGLDYSECGYGDRSLAARPLPPGRGTIHTAQRGLRTGTLFASSDAFSFLYLQDFSSLTDYFEATKRSPAESVGGHWPELGYAPPAGPDCILPKAREIVVSDAYLVLADRVPETPAAAAPMFLDMLAEVYLDVWHGRLPFIMTGPRARQRRCSTCQARRCALTRARANAISDPMSETTRSRPRVW